MTEHVSSVSSPVGTFRSGAPVGPPSAPTGSSGHAAYLTLEYTAPVIDDARPGPLDWVHGVIGPDGRDFEVGGTAQVTRDNADAISARLPWVLLVIAAISYVLLFLLTGSLVLPLKAIALNTLSLDRNVRRAGVDLPGRCARRARHHRTGSIVAQVPVLLFCVAFGLSMDYEVFLISRIREFWLASEPGTAVDNDRAIALGLAGTGRIVTAAALLMSISFAALMASQVSIMRMFGLGLTLAIVMDATLVRMLLVPAFMHLLGRRNWWAPDRIACWHRRFSVTERPGPPSASAAGADGRHRLPANFGRV